MAFFVGGIRSLSIEQRIRTRDGAQLDRSTTFYAELCIHSTSTCNALLGSVVPPCGLLPCLWLQTPRLLIIHYTDSFIFPNRVLSPEWHLR
jgi:hypothetical protein